MNQQLLLIDGSSYIFRAFYGVKAFLTSPEGLPTNAVFGFKNMLFQLLHVEKPSHVVMVFDPKGPTFRNQLYSEYKANRSATPEDLNVQFEPIHRLVESLNIPMLVVPNYEADDVIGTLTKQFKGQITVKIISGDKDLTQLITPDVTMLDTMRSFVFNEKSVEEKFGVPPNQITELLALMGDASDNIPGAKGVGPKTAVKLLKDYGSIDGVYQNTDKLKGKLKEKVEASEANVRLSLTLTQIQCDLKLDVNLNKFEYQNPDLEKLTTFYKDIGFKQDGFFRVATVKANQTSVSVPVELKSEIDRSQYRLIQKEDDLVQIRDQILEKKKVILDLETTSLRAIDADIVGIALCLDGEPAVYIPISHNQFDQQISIQKGLEILDPVFKDPEITVIGQNIKYDLIVLANYDIYVSGIIEDTMIQSYLIDSESHRHGLDHLALQHLNHTMIKYDDVAGKGKKQVSFADVDIHVAKEYAAEDADVTSKIYEKLKKSLQSVAQLPELYSEIEIPLCRILVDIERNGVKVDSEYLKELSTGFVAELAELEKKIYQEAGKEFNINSPKQLGVVLFEDLQIQTGKKKTKSSYSTDVNVLEKIAEVEPIGIYLLEYRKKTKLVNTYLDVLPKLVSPKTGRIHTSYNQAVTATGRLSSTSPNLQNIPIKGKEGVQIRKAFIAEEGFLIMAADYSQIELRVLAHIANDSGLIQAFQSGADIHKETASAIFHIASDAVTLDQRRIAKAINFGLIYGMGAFRLSQEMGISRKEAQTFIDTYFQRFSKIKDYIDETIQFAKDNLYVETIFYRRRSMTGINASNAIQRKATERIAANTRIQGSAADLIKKAMIQVQEKMLNQNLKSRMIMQVHDELVFEVKTEEVDLMKSLVKQEMESVFKLKVPLTVDIGVGKNWQEAH
ncbi:MAG: DNA polymerase-1 [bacterium]|jgi:DNA polymerase-1